MRAPRRVERYQSPHFEVRQIQAIGLSMFPALWSGDRIDLGIGGSVSSGDIVAFVGEDGCRLAHRVVGRCSVNGDYLTIGDANANLDPPVPESAIIGRVLRVRRCVLGQWVSVPDVLWRRRLASTGAGRVIRRFVLRMFRAFRGLSAG